jgi:hypothetical protein
MSNNDLVSPAYCPQCRRAIPADVEHCPHCGAAASIRARMEERGGEVPTEQLPADELPVPGIGRSWPTPGEGWLAVILPPVGILYGLAHVVRGNDLRGQKQIWLSAVASVAWAILPWFLWATMMAAIVEGLGGR